MFDRKITIRDFEKGGDYDKNPPVGETDSKGR